MKRKNKASCKENLSYIKKKINNKEKQKDSNHSIHEFEKEKIVFKL